MDEPGGHLHMASLRPFLLLISIWTYHCSLMPADRFMPSSISPPLRAAQLFYLRGGQPAPTASRKPVDRHLSAA